MVVMTPDTRCIRAARQRQGRRITPMEQTRAAGRLQVVLYSLVCLLVVLGVGSALG